MHATIEQKCMVLFHLIFLFSMTIRPKIRVHIGLFFYVHATIRPKYMALFHLFFLLNTTNRPKIKVHTDLFILFVHHHSTKIHGPHWFIFFMCTRPFNKNIWSFFINSFFCARPIDRKLRSTLTYFFICTRPFDQKLPSKHFNVVSTLSFGWCDFATRDNVKSTLKQRYVFQRWNLQRLTTSNQRWHEQR